MNVCGYTACPNDSHEIIKDISDYILNKNGGNGVVREILEELLKIDFIKILYGS
jgi:3-deoxy-D-manno-octulosonate 8-phosphate phosphatase (KDO 8-P phosphatase)